MISLSFEEILLLIHISTYFFNNKITNADLTFIVTGFDSEENHVEETIVMLGGRLVPKTYSSIPDYGVVPVHGAPLKHTVNEIVNDLFIVSIFCTLIPYF